MQQKLLQKAATLLRPGGILVYCTCSLEPEEGEHAAAELLRQNDGLRRIPVTAGEVGGLDSIVSDTGDLRTLPCHLPHEDPRMAGMDGFFVTRLQKI